MLSRRERVLVYLASKSTKCATLEEILEVLQRAGVLNVQDPRQEVLKLLSKMAHRGSIKRGWITAENKKVRVYCIDLD